ncbi:MAG: PA4780 family RIO1-like protein kinase [Myxococcales bacterium]
MRTPDTLFSLMDYGIIEEVLRPLMSGKEAQVYLVRSSGELRVAKVYKDAQKRTFKNRADYVEGRKVRNSRDQRAMDKGSRHGRAREEAAWRTTEVDTIYRLRDAGVRVPTPYHFVDGVLVMELVSLDGDEPAPRLGDVVLDREGAQQVFDHMLAEVVRMLAAGVVHGDLSDFNVLMGLDGPVIIDFPQAIDASSNQNARKILRRDVDNLHNFLARFTPDYRPLPYAQEMWALYERGELTPDTKLVGRYRPEERKVSTDSVLGLIGDANRDERRRRERLGLSMRGASDPTQSSSGLANAENAARPLSKYAQKREAQVAARMLEAANRPPPQKGGRGRDGSSDATQASSRQAKYGSRRRGGQQRGRSSAQQSSASSAARPSNKR